MTTLLTNTVPDIPEPADPASVVLRIGARFTTAARTSGDRIVASRVVSHGAILLAASQAAAAGASGAATARVIRSAAQQVAHSKPFGTSWQAGGRVLGAAGVASALVALSASGGSSATVRQIREVTDRLGACWADEKRSGPSQPWIQPMLVGGAMLEALLELLGASEIEVEADLPRATAPIVG